MRKNEGSRAASPYDLNATVKDRKTADFPKSRPSEQNPYALSHKTSLKALSAKSTRKG
jgi:hypothetical protein